MRESDIGVRRSVFVFVVRGTLFYHLFLLPLLLLPGKSSQTVSVEEEGKGLSSSPILFLLLERNPFCSSLPPSSSCSHVQVENEITRGLRHQPPPLLLLLPTLPGGGALAAFVVVAFSAALFGQSSSRRVVHGRGQAGVVVRLLLHLARSSALNIGVGYFSLVVVGGVPLAGPPLCPLPLGVSLLGVLGRQPGDGSVRAEHLALYHRVEADALLADRVQAAEGILFVLILFPLDAGRLGGDGGQFGGVGNEGGDGLLGQAAATLGLG